MTDIAELHAQALDATGRIVAGIAADRWHADTPCDGWDVRALVNHVVAGNLWAAELAAGQDTALDAGLMQACREVIEPQLEAFRGAGALADPLPVPAGASDQTRFLAMLGRAG